MADTSRYWATEEDGAELVRRASERFARSLKAKAAQGVTERSRRLLSAYYGRGVDGARSAAHASIGGEQGELLQVSHNAVRPLVTQVLGLIAGQRPAMKPIATNTDATSLAQAQLADRLREFFERTLSMASVELDTVRGGLLAGSFWLVQSWNRALGTPVTLDPETGREVKTGDIELASLPWWRCAADSLARRPQDRQWVLFRRPGNRHDLAATYPDCAERLIHAQDHQSPSEWVQKIIGGADVQSLDTLFGDSIDGEDGVWVWELRHIPSPALPTGRLVRFVDDDIILFDSLASGGDYPYEGLHAFEYAPERVVGSGVGHSPSFDLLGLQEMADVCMTSVSTSVNLLGMPHLWSGGGPSGGINAYAMSSGPTVVESPVEPKVLQFPAVNGDVVNVLGLFRDLMRESAALNKTVMGEPDKGMPASAQALQRAQAVQYHQAAQGEYLSLVESNVTGVLQLCQRFAKSPRVAEIAGKSGDYEVREWSAKDVDGVRRFAAEPINPMLRSYEARMSLAETLAERGWLTKEGFLSVYTTGDVKEPLEASTTRLELISRHKQMLRDGVGMPPVDMQASMQSGAPVFLDDGKPHVRLMKSDPHWLAYDEYRSVLDSPAARENPAVVQAVTDVLQETLRLWASLSPDELAAAGGQPLPSQMMPPPGAPLPGAGGPPSAPGGPSSNPTPPGDSGAQLPTPPADPITGQHQGREALGGLPNA